jgi:transposase
MLSYKADWYGRKLIKVDRYYPSSQLCNCCGYKNTALDINDRQWVCPSCKSKLDRDYNASLNILTEGLRISHSS